MSINHNKNLKTIYTHAKVFFKYEIANDLIDIIKQVA